MSPATLVLARSTAHPFCESLQRCFRHTRPELSGPVLVLQPRPPVFDHDPSRFLSGLENELGYRVEKSLSHAGTTKRLPLSLNNGLGPTRGQRLGPAIQPNYCQPPQGPVNLEPLVVDLCWLSFQPFLIARGLHGARAQTRPSSHGRRKHQGGGEGEAF